MLLYSVKRVVIDIGVFNRNNTVIGKNVLELCKRKSYTGSSGNVVNDNGKIGSVRDSGVVAFDLTRLETVIERRNGSDGVSARFFGVSRKVAGDARAYCSDVSDNLFAVRNFNSKLENLFSLFLSQREAFCGRTADINAVSALVKNVSFDFCECIVVDTAVFVECGKQRYQNVSLFAHNKSPSFYINKF